MKSTFFIAAFFCSLASTAHASAADFRYEDLVALVRDRHIQSIEALLPLLPVELRSNYTLFHDSQSLQVATWNAPRVVMFGHDGKLTCTFNGDSKQLGFDDFECYQFRDETRSFEFRAIRFPSPQNGLKQPLFSKSDRTPDGKTNCSGCHEADLRPNFEEYPKWPGAYGSADDNLTDGSGPIGEERAHYLEFLKVYRNQGRYQFLTHEAGQPENPYLLEHQDSSYASRPNLRYTQLVGKLTGLRNARIIEKQTSSIQATFLFLSSFCPLSPDQAKMLKLRFHSPVQDVASFFKALHFHPIFWTSKFRAYEPGCQDCTSSDTAGPYDANEGTFGLNAETGNTVVSDWIAAGNTSWKGIQLQSGPACELAAQMMLQNP